MEEHQDSWLQIRQKKGRGTGVVVPGQRSWVILTAAVGSLWGRCSLASSSRVIPQPARYHARADHPTSLPPNSLPVSVSLQASNLGGWKQSPARAGVNCPSLSRSATLSGADAESNTSARKGRPCGLQAAPYRLWLPKDRARASSAAACLPDKHSMVSS